MKFIIYLIIIGLICKTGFAQNGQIVYQAVPTPGNPSLFNNLYDPNISLNTAANFSSNFSASNCSILPGRQFIESATTYSDRYERSYGKCLSFKITPKAGYKIVLKSIGFKITSSQNDVRFRVGYSTNQFASFIVSPNDYVATSYVCGIDDTTAVPLQTFSPSSNPQTSDSYIVDSQNGIAVRLYFFNAPTSAQINVIRLQLNGCVVDSAASIDCLGNSISIGQPLNTANYSTTPTFEEQFDGNAYNRNFWKPRLGSVFGGLIKAESDTVYNGSLHIRFRADTVRNATGKLDSIYYGGGLISTLPLRYGYYEIQGQLYGATRGLHQSFWCTGNAGTPTSIANDSTSRGDEMSEIQCFEFDSEPMTYRRMLPSIYLSGNANWIAFANVPYIDPAPPTAQTFTTGFELTPDSFKVYYNNKLKVSYACTDTVKKYSIAEPWQLSAVATPKGYYINPIPLPVSGAEMRVDYFRFYAPASPNGINFIGNCIFGVQSGQRITPRSIHKPAGWVNALNYDINQKLVSPVYDTIATSLTDSVYVPDKDNATALMHYKNTAYRTSTRQVLAGIPNGKYQMAVYVRCSNIPADTVLMRVKTLKKDGTTTLYTKSINLGNNIADTIWRKVFLNNVAIDSNNAIVEFYSNAAANSYTVFDSATFMGDVRPKPLIGMPPTNDQLMGDTDYIPATINYGLTPSLSSSNTSVAQIINNKIHITGIGTATIRAWRADDDYFQQADTTMQVLTISRSRPYKANIIPGTIQAEDYDFGHEGYAYHDADPVNKGGKYRNDGVDIYDINTTAATYKVGLLSSGEYMYYTINALSEGLYRMKIFYSNGGTSTPSCQIMLDDDVATQQSVSMVPTRNWNVYDSIAITMQLSAGKHLVKLEILPNVTFNIDRYSFEKEEMLSVPTSNKSAIIAKPVLEASDTAKTSADLAIYPNPTQSGTLVYVPLQLQKKATVELSVIDIKGTVLINRTLGEYPVGLSYYNLETTGLNPGMYIIQTRFLNRRKSYKCLIK